MEENYGNVVEVNLKKSSSKEGKIGYDIKVKATDTATKEKLTELANMALEIALKSNQLLTDKGL